MGYSEMLRKALEETRHVKPKATFDSCGDDKKDEPVLDGAGDYTANDIAMRAAAAVQEWAETDDLDEGETLVDRLMALMIGIADSNKDGKLSEDEQDIVMVALGAAYDYLSSKGVSDEDASALLNDGDEDAANRVRDLIASQLPDGEDDADADIDNFVFSESDQEAVMDSCLDAVYRKTFAVRGGKKVKINKRISGTVRLSAKQKVAIRKAQMKSHSAGAMARRLKSMKVRTRLGLNKK